MVYFKSLNVDGSLNRIGIQDTLPTNGIEITCEEYNNINKAIVEESIRQAEAEELEFGYLNSEEGGDTVE